MSVWNVLRDHCQIGSQVATSQLGRVAYEKNERGEFQGIIPRAIQQEASAHGFEVLAADFRRDTYTVRRIQ